MSTRITYTLFIISSLNLIACDQNKEPDDLVKSHNSIQLNTQEEEIDTIKPIIEQKNINSQIHKKPLLEYKDDKHASVIEFAKMSIRIENYVSHGGISEIISKKNEERFCTWSEKPSDSLVLKKINCDVDTVFLNEDIANYVQGNILKVTTNGNNDDINIYVSEQFNTMNGKTDWTEKKAIDQLYKSTFKIPLFGEEDDNMGPDYIKVIIERSNKGVILDIKTLKIECSYGC